MVKLSIFREGLILRAKSDTCPFSGKPFKCGNSCFVFIDIVVQDYIAVKEKYATYLPHTAGRYAAKRFRKAQVIINNNKTFFFLL